MDAVLRAEKRKRDEEEEAAGAQKKTGKTLFSYLQTRSPPPPFSAVEEPKKEEDTADKQQTKVAATPEELLLAGTAGSGFNMANGEADSSVPKVKVVAKEWWKGTMHKGGAGAGTLNGISAEEEMRRGNWFCESYHCESHENPKLAMKCQKCGATRRAGQEGYRPEMRSSAGDHARYDYGADNRAKMAGH